MKPLKDYFKRLCSEESTTSSLRFVMVLFSLVYAILWAVISWNKQELQQIPESVVISYSTILFAKVVQKGLEGSSIESKIVGFAQSVATNALNKSTPTNPQNVEGEA